jgi:hypothetical protein
MNYRTNVERLTTNREVISRVREIERRISHNLNEAERINGLLDGLQPIIQERQNTQLAIMGLNMVSQAQALTREANELHETLSKVLDDLRAQQGGRIRKKR